MTIVKQLSTTPQSNGVVQTAANTGWTGAPSIGASGTATFQSDEANGAPVGYRFTQSGAGTVFAYIDLPTALQDIYMLIEFEADNTSADTSILRLLGNTAHTDNRASLLLTTTERAQFVEGPAAGLSVTTPSPNPFTAASPYVMDFRYKGSTDLLLINYYELGNPALFLSLSGTLVHASVDIAAIRWGIASASALTRLGFNSNFKIGDAPIARTDVSNSLPTANAGTDKTVEAGQSFTLQGAGSDVDGTITAHTWTPIGSAVALSGSGTGVRTGVAPITADGLAMTYSLTVTDNEAGVSPTADTVTVTALPAPLLLAPAVAGGAMRPAVRHRFS